MAFIWVSRLSNVISISQMVCDYVVICERTIFNTPNMHRDKSLEQSNSSGDLSLLIENFYSNHLHNNEIPAHSSLSIYSCKFYIYIYYMQDTNIGRFSNRNIDQNCLYQLS